MPQPHFVSEVAAKLSPTDVRLAFPRVTHVCECGVATICYASFEHFIAGDW